MTTTKHTGDSGPLRGVYTTFFSLLFSGLGYCIGYLTGYGALRLAAILGVIAFIVFYARLGLEEEFR